jgi:hypothetical protein
MPQRERERERGERGERDDLSGKGAARGKQREGKERPDEMARENGHTEHASLRSR